jgi:hypothetical protein
VTSADHLECAAFSRRSPVNYRRVVLDDSVCGLKPGRFSRSGYDELRSEVQSTYGEMVPFSNTDYANHLNEIPRRLILHE